MYRASIDGLGGANYQGYNQPQNNHFYLTEKVLGCQPVRVATQIQVSVCKCQHQSPKKVISKCLPLPNTDLHQYAPNIYPNHTSIWAFHFSPWVSPEGYITQEIGMETGNFTLQDGSFFSGGNKYLIRARKTLTNKPPLYLIQLNPFRFISSLYPKSGEENIYTFDDRRNNTLYILRKSEDEVEIAELE